MTAASPWAAIAGPAPLPQWEWPARAFRLLDRPPPRPVAMPRRGPARKPRTRCRPWALLRPGTDQERDLLARLDASWPLLHG